MLRVAVIIGVLAGVCSAAFEGCCSLEERRIVQRQWNSLWRDSESTDIKIYIGRAALLKVVEVYPETKALFKNVNIDNPESGEFTAHAMRILNALDMTINLLDDRDSLDAALDHLAVQHKARLGVKVAHFKAFFSSLAPSLKTVLPDFDTMSWTSCLTLIIGTMTSSLPQA